MDRSTRPAGDGSLNSLARFAARLEPGQLPAGVLDTAKACILFAMAVGMASLRSKQAEQAASIGSSAGAGGARRFFDGAFIDPGEAAFANGTLFHARVQDDAHPAGHVGVVVVPAALALAGRTGVDGGRFLASVVAGYEVALRIGREHAADSSARGFRSTPIYGVFGAAAAAGKLVGLDEMQLTHALALSANLACGLREFSEAGSEDFPFQAGFAASSGIMAARLAAVGATGAASALDGKAGFFRAYGTDAERYGRRLTDGLGTSFEIEAVTYKPYPICQFHRGIVRGAAALRLEAGGADLQALAVRMHPFEADFYGVRFAGPFRTFPQAFMSAPLCAALGWLHGAATYAGLTDFEDARASALARRVTIIADGARERYAPTLEARLADGRHLKWAEREGADAYLLTWQAACRMTQELVGEAGIAASYAQRLSAAVERLNHSGSISELLDVMVEACRAARTRANHQPTLTP